MAEVKTSKLYYYNIGLVIVFIIALIVIKVNNNDFSIKSFYKWLAIGVAIFGAIAGLIFYFNNKKDDSITDKNTLPPAITFLQARSLMIKNLSDPMYMDEIDLSSKEIENVEEVGKPPSKVYCFVGKGKFSSDRYAIGINMHYPETMNSILTNPKSDYAITKMIKGLASYPQAEPEVTTTVAKNPLLGTEVVTTETKKTEEKEDSSDKEDDLDK